MYYTLKDLNKCKSVIILPRSIRIIFVIFYREKKCIYFKSFNNINAAAECIIKQQANHPKWRLEIYFRKYGGIKCIL